MAFRYANIIIRLVVHRPLKIKCRLMMNLN